MLMTPEGGPSTRASSSTQRVGERRFARPAVFGGDHQTERPIWRIWSTIACGWVSLRSALWRSGSLPCLQNCLTALISILEIRSGRVWAMRVMKAILFGDRSRRAPAEFEKLAAGDPRFADQPSEKISGPRPIGSGDIRPLVQRPTGDRASPSPRRSPRWNSRDEDEQLRNSVNVLWSSWRNIQDLIPMSPCRNQNQIGIQRIAGLNCWAERMMNRHQISQ